MTDKRKRKEEEGQTTVYKTQHRKDRATRTPLKLGVNQCGPGR
jgi:hypothetical protein